MAFVASNYESGDSKSINNQECQKYFDIADSVSQGDHWFIYILHQNYEQRIKL